MVTVSGMRIYRPDGSIKMDLTDRVARVLRVMDSATESITVNTWWTIPEAPVIGELWGVCMPVGDLQFNNLYGSSVGTVLTDPINNPNQINVQVTVGDRFILIYGVY